MSLTVAVYINDRPIIARTCRNIAHTGDEDEYIYKVDDGRRIAHKRSEGAKRLAIELLEGVEEV